MSRICFITPSLKTGGGTRVFVELANKLCISHEVYLIYPNNSHSISHFNLSDAVNLISVGKFRNTKLNKIINLFKVIQYLNSNFNDAIIIYTDPLFSIIANLIKSNNKYRFIQADDYAIFDDGLVLGDGLLLSIYKTLTQYSYSYNCNYIFNSKYVYEQYVKISKRQDVPFNLVHPAINETFISSPNNRGNKINICLVARKHPWKGLTTFIDAYKELDVAIKEQLGEVFLISHDCLDAFDISGMNIIRPQNDMEIAHVYKSCDIFISTSWWEGFGLPPIEAMGCGCATIVSDSGGVNEYARPTENCLMYKPKDIEGLKNCLSILFNNPTMRHQLSMNGYNTAKKFNWDRSATQLIDIINS